MSDHAKLAPSAASRWAACPGSLALIDMMYEEGALKVTGNAASDRGTMLHDFAADVLTGQKALGDLENDDEGVEITAGYLGAINDYEEMLGGTDRHCRTHIEVKLRSPKWHKDIWGTADCVLRGKKDKHLIILDLKTGYVPVVAENNYQLMCYAILAIGHFRIRPKKITLAIYQPKAGDALPALREWTVDIHTLDMWAGEIKQAAKLALSEQGAHIYRPGVAQCKWCPAAGQCSAQAQSSAVADFFDGPADGALMSDDQVADMLNKLPQVDAFISSLRKAAHDRAMQGRIPPGWKLVESRTKRKWSDPGEVFAILKSKRVKRDLYINESLKSFTQVLKDPRCAGLVKHLIVKPKGTPQLAPEADARDEITPGADFED